MLYTRFVGVQEELNISYDIRKDLDSLKLELNKSISADYLVSRGEYLTAKLMSSYLGYQFVDVEENENKPISGRIEEITNKKIKFYMI